MADKSKDKEAEPSEKEDNDRQGAKKDSASENDEGKDKKEKDALKDKVAEINKQISELTQQIKDLEAEKKNLLQDDESKEDGISNDSDFKKVFEDYSKFGDRQNDGSTIALRNIDKWLKQAGIFTNHDITSTDTAIMFASITKFNKIKITLKEFDEFLDLLAKDKGMHKKELVLQLSDAGDPELTDVTAFETEGPVGAMLERLDAQQASGSDKDSDDKEGKDKDKLESSDKRSNDEGGKDKHKEGKEQPKELSDNEGGKEKHKEGQEQPKERSDNEGGKDKDKEGQGQPKERSDKESAKAGQESHKKRSDGEEDKGKEK